MVVNPISVTVLDSDDTDTDEEFRRTSLISRAEQEARHRKIEEARLGLGGSRVVNEDPDFVPEIDDTASPIKKRKRKEKVVSDSTPKKRSKAVRIYERKRRRATSKLLMIQASDTPPVTTSVQATTFQRPAAKRTRIT